MASSTSLSNTPAASHSVRRPQGGLTGLTEPGCEVPGAAGDQPNEDPLEAVPVRDAQPVAAQWVHVGGAVVVGGLAWPSRALRRHGDPWRARRPPVDSLKKQNPKYCYFEHGYFKPGGVG